MRRPRPTLADYVVIAISPALIMVLVGSLIFFLLAVFYQGQFETRLNFIMAMFILAAVLIARISIEEGREYAMLFAVPLAIVTSIALFRFVQFQGPLATWSWLINLGLIALIWWSADRLTWDCTVIDESKDASGEGLLQTVGLTRKATAAPPGSPPVELEGTTSRETPSAPASSGSPGFWRRFVESRRRPHAPGVWVIYFSLAALPIFGLGQWFGPATDLATRRYVFQLLVAFVAAALGLLLTTSFLGLRRYLRQRRLEMPADMAAVWMGVGACMILGLLLVCLLLPRRNPEYSVTHLPFLAGSRQDLWTSQHGFGRDGPNRDDADRTGPQPRPPMSDTSQANGQKSPGQQRQQTNSSGQQQGPSGQQSGPSGQQSGPSGQQSGPSGQQGGPSGQQGGSSGQQGGSSGQQGGPSGQQGGSSGQQGGSSGQQSGSSGQQSGSSGRQGRTSGQDAAGKERGDQPSSASKRPGEGNQGSQRGGQDRAGGEPGDKGRETGDNGDSPGGEQQLQQAQESGRSGSDSQGRGGQQRQSDQPQQPASQGEGQQPQQQGSGEPPDSPSPDSSSSSAEKPPSGSRPAWSPTQLIPQVGASFASLLKFLYWLAVVVILGFLLWRYWPQVLRALQQFLSTLREFWSRLFAGQSAAPAAGATAEGEALAAPRPFADFADPFQTGEAGRWSLDDLVRYSFLALEAWARERGCPRAPEQTPTEFALTVARHQHDVGRDAVQLAELYNVTAYGRRVPGTANLNPLRRLWQTLRAPTA